MLNVRWTLLPNNGKNFANLKLHSDGSRRKTFFVISLTVPPRVEKSGVSGHCQWQLHEDFSTQKLELTTPPWGLLQVPSKFESFRSFRPSVWSYYLINTGTCDRCDHPSDANRRRRQPIFIRVWCPLVSGCFILNSQKISPRRCATCLRWISVNEQCDQCFQCALIDQMNTWMLQCCSNDASSSLISKGSPTMTQNHDVSAPLTRPQGSVSANYLQLEWEILNWIIG